MKIGILTEQNGYNRGACDFYPVIKWKKKFSEDSIDITFIKNHENKKIYDNNVVIIDHRYYRRLVVLDKIYDSLDFIIEFIASLKDKGIKVILFDNDDGAGSKQWNLIEYVDLFVKKQILKNKVAYTENKGTNSYMVFVKDYDLTEDLKNANNKFKEGYVPCPKDQLNKIKLGWNIGMLDYRYFPLRWYFPFGTNRVLNSIYKAPNFNSALNEKDIDSAFRGKIRKDNLNYSFQRNKVIGLLEKLDDGKFVTGGIIPKNKYLKELRSSKTCVSPFGWGEVCYRDFEAIIAGAILLKPDMSHLETYPDIYKKWETYVPLKWDMSDLEEKLMMVVDNFDDYKSLVYQAQYLYKKALNDYQTFKNKFLSLVGG